MAANTAGIQTLLDAEKEAAKIVQKARDYRTQRVKDARGEAAKEIEAYKGKQEAEYQSFDKEHSGDNETLAAEQDKQTDQQLDEIRKQFDSSKKAVVDQLLERVIELCLPVADESLLPATLVEMFGPAQYASVNGILYMLRGFGGLLGTPVAGLLIRDSGMAALPKAYWSSAVLVSAFTTGATLAVSWAWLEVRRRKKTGGA